MRKILQFVFGISAFAGLNIGFVMILFFLYHHWGAIGVVVGLTFVPPIIICPVWQWIATGYWLTFLFVYVFGFVGMALYKLVED
jgi:hypothetical protein